MEFKKTLPSKH